jgi:FAD/FMN-containing dehydrogenase
MELNTIDLRRMDRVIELTPEDMTVTVESGISLGALQRELAKHGQWLPIDPPRAETVSIHEMLANNLSGPRRFGYGTIREHLIGMKVALADGRVIRSGGKVVKNVAGYDLAKLFIGAQGTLGIIVEATFKLRPLPETERFVSAQLALDGSHKMLRATFDSELTPVVLDMFRMGEMPAVSIVVGFAGTQTEVDWQLGKARSLGLLSDATLAYATQFWDNPAPVNRISILPSRLVEAVASLGAVPFVARAGNGVIYHRSNRTPEKSVAPTELMRRLKAAYDPKNILPELAS